MNYTLTTADGYETSSYRTGAHAADHGLVVVQEIFGVNNHIRDVCERFAAEGYEVIAPALFDRIEPNVELDYSAESVTQGLKIRNEISLIDSLADIQAAIDAFGDKPVNIVGYCWGGLLAWHAASKLKGLRASSCWYGAGIAQALDEKPRVPVQLHFGVEDKSIPADEIVAIQSAHPDVAIYNYPAAGHGFGCDQRGSFNREAYELAQERTLAFFKNIKTESNAR